MTMRFFKRNILDQNTSMSATSANTALMTNLYDNDTEAKLPSIGSNDATPEEWVFDFGTSKIIDAIQVANHNIKSGKIEYWNGSAYVDFSTPIAWSANSAADNYFSFTQVVTTKIKVKMDTTIVVNAQKYIGELRFLQLIGSLLQAPSKFDISFIEKTKDLTLDNGGSLSVFFGESAQIKMSLNDVNSTDAALLRTIKNYRTQFYIYPNGGSDTVTWHEGLRVRDMYLVNWVSDFMFKLPSGHLTNSIVGMDITLKEVV